MISWIRDYTVQSIFVAIQATIIIYGIMVTGTLLKVNGYPEFDQFAWYSLFVRHAGFLILIIPGFWVWLTIWYDLSNRISPEAFTIVTGIVLMFLLYQFFSLSAAGADRKWGLFREVTQISQPQIHQAEQARALNAHHARTCHRDLTRLPS
ncbi:hypothetical protein VSU19_04185 [Verrucomicrobiales bacterium BCK34]|nr:hypothetical protein [Verrucomicrobiales bacterium BCK34]